MPEDAATIEGGARMRGLLTRATAVAGAGLLAATVSLISLGSGAPAGAARPNIPAPQGYWMVADDGGVFAFGLPFLGSMGGVKLNKPVVGIASPSSTGYWEVASDGGIFAFGAPFFGSMGGKTLNAPVVGIADDFGAPGYWEVASDGGVFNFGGAPFLGSMGGQKLSAPIVGIASTGDGGGYWEVGADGALYAFGDAVYPSNYLGHLPGPTQPGTAQAGFPTATGIAGFGSDNVSFVVVATDGTAYPYGNVQSGALKTTVTSFVVGVTTTATGTASAGFWSAGADGSVYSFGTATSKGSLVGVKLNRPIVGIDGY
jgi:hypothetical protein